MTPEAVRRYGRQLALADFGPEAQAAVLAARVVVSGAGLLAETAARYLAAGGVGELRLPAVLRDVPGLAANLSASQPGLRLVAFSETNAPLEVLADATLLVHASFDDDPWLPSAVRRGVPAIFARALDDRVDVLSLRRQGPCPHVPLDRPRLTSPGASSALAASLEVVAGTLAAAEALRLIGEHGRSETHAIATPGAGHAPSSPARLLRLTLAGGPPIVQDIPWSPACFACGGQGLEMSFT